MNLFVWDWTLEAEQAKHWVRWSQKNLCIQHLVCLQNVLSERARVRTSVHTSVDTKSGYESPECWCCKQTPWRSIWFVFFSKGGGLYFPLWSRHPVRKVLMNKCKQTIVYIFFQILLTSCGAKIQFYPFRVFNFNSFEQQEMSLYLSISIKNWYFRCFL